MMQRQFLESWVFAVFVAILAVSCRTDRVKRHVDPLGKAENGSMQFMKIGVIRSPYTPEKKAPRQGRLAPDVESVLVLDPEYESALKDIESFSHILVVYAFDRAAGWDPLVQTPWEETLHGVFATRSPRRPNPIGITVVELVKRVGPRLHVRGLDAFDGTPLLDLKPYMPRFDRIEEAVSGWMGERHRDPD